MSSPSFNTVLPIVAGVLATKQALIGLLTVRARLAGKDFATGRPKETAMPEDTAMPEWIVKLFSALLLAQGPTPSIDRLNGVTNNSAQYEPFFLGLAAALAVAGSAPSWGPSALIAFASFRVAHALAYITAVPQPARALTWLGGTVVTLGLGVSAIFKIFKK